MRRVLSLFIASLIAAPGVALSTTGPSRDDPDQAFLIDYLNRHGGVLQQLDDNAIKLQIFNREMEILKETRKQQSTIANAIDSLSNVLPFKDYFSRTGNVPGVEASFLSLPSTRENREIAQLWDMPPEQFAAALPFVFQNFTSQYFGLGTDFSKGVDVARQFQAHGLNQSDANSFDLWAGLNLAAVVSLFYWLLRYMALNWRRVRRSASIRDRSGNVERGGARILIESMMGKRILLFATPVAILMFVFPPTNSVLGENESFSGWHPLWTIGNMSEQVNFYRIAYPMLLAEWALLALIAITVVLLGKK